MCIFYVKQFLEGIHVPVLIFKNPSESTDQCIPIQHPSPISAKTHAIPGV